MNIDQATLDGIRSAPENSFRYIQMGEDENSIASSIVYFIDSQKEQTFIYGAYYGYCGGGVNDGGYFIIDVEGGEAHSFDYNDLDDFSEERSLTKNALEFLMSLVWAVMEESDDMLEANELGARLLATAEDGYYASEGFDTDALAAISEQWRISLRFED